MGRSSATVLRNKYDADGILNRRKARVVAKGYTQRPGIDFFGTYRSGRTSRFSSIADSLSRKIQFESFSAGLHI